MHTCQMDVINPRPIFWEKHCHILISPLSSLRWRWVLFTSCSFGARSLHQHTPWGLRPHDVSFLWSLAETLGQREGLQRWRSRRLWNHRRCFGRSPAALFQPCGGGVGPTPVRRRCCCCGGWRGSLRLRRSGGLWQRRSCRDTQVSCFDEAFQSEHKRVQPQHSNTQLQKLIPKVRSTVMVASSAS